MVTTYGFFAILHAIGLNWQKLKVLVILNAIGLNWQKIIFGNSECNWA